MRRLPLTICFAILSFGSSGKGQTPQSFIQKALALEDSSRTLPRYTYYVLDHTQNRAPNGKIILDSTTLYDYTWIGNMPYGRVVESQGKPLKGKALVAEQARYEKAMADHTNLDPYAWTKDKKPRTILDASLHLEPFLTPSYLVRELRQEQLDGNMTHVIDCEPAPSTDATRHATLWITDDGKILRTLYELVSDEDGRLRGSHGQTDYQLIDGNRLPLHSVFHLNAPHGFTGDFEKTYSRYRLFTVAVRISPATAVEDDSK